MHVLPSGGQIYNYCKWCHLVVKCATNASGVIWWPIFQLMPYCHVVAKFNQSHGVNFWVRCASGNVSLNQGIRVLKLHFKSECYDWWEMCNHQREIRRIFNILFFTENVKMILKPQANWLMCSSLWYFLTTCFHIDLTISFYKNSLEEKLTN